jgi:hypothetical protein
MTLISKGRKENYLLAQVLTKMERHSPKKVFNFLSELILMLKQ